ncbi:MAG: hypothetical protein HC846_06515 [Blastocatellia bacterium]|nr:hypothetical protein [Blastocatellia bacterium]
MTQSAENFARLIRSKILGGKILSLQLSDKYNPHFAKILLQNFQNKRIAVVVELQNETSENLLTFALLWFYELQKLKTKSAEKLWIVSNKSAELAKLCTALRDEWQRKINIFDIQLVEKFDEFAETKKAKLFKPPKVSPTAQKIISLAPENIQIQGKNLTFNGLPFVKIGKDKTWFGIENRQCLDQTSWNDLTQLVENLTAYRRNDSPNKSHAFYKLLPEAWLESILRNEISVLDANLILSPLHNQFRASSEQIDLLALRKDGRLVIIELKVSPNREHLFQAVDYWQVIEKQRVVGNLKGLFGKLEIADAPSLVYLVAPHSCFHKDFDFLAKTVSDEIEIYRFDINENWREKVEVIERRRLD